MTQLPAAGWYQDPTHAYGYRYWNGSQWTNQVSTGGTSEIDPSPLDPSIAATPPAPGTAAPPQPAAIPSTVEVTQAKSGVSVGAIVGILVAVVAVVILIAVLVAVSGDDSTNDTAIPTPTEAPAPTQAPAPTEAPGDDG